MSEKCAAYFSWNTLMAQTREWVPHQKQDSDFCKKLSNEVYHESFSSAEAVKEKVVEIFPPSEVVATVS